MSHSNHKTTSVFVVAVTGGVASGKSMVTTRFQQLGADVYDADSIARELVAPDQPALAEIVAIFGRIMLTPTGELDRQRLRNHIFANPNARRQLEAILHPRVHDTLYTYAQNTTAPYCVLAIPLFVESGNSYFWVDHVLVIDTPESLQIQRLMQRDGITQTQAQQILAAQASRTERLALADDVIENHGIPEELMRAVDALHPHYLQLATAKRTEKQTL